MTGESARVVAYQVGGWYQQQDGEWVQLLGVSSPGSHYECMYSIDEAGNRIHRYTNRPGDYGRVTGSPHDYSDPRNIPPLVPESALAEQRDAYERSIADWIAMGQAAESKLTTLLSGLEALAGEWKREVGLNDPITPVVGAVTECADELLALVASAGLEGKGSG